VREAAPPELIAVEKNLSTLGFFNVTAPAVSGEGVTRVVRHRSIVDGVEVEGSVTYLGSALHGGLPTAADQDVYLAVLAIVTEVWQETGELPQMIAVAPTDLLRRMGRQMDGGRQYDVLEKALQRIVATTIVSEHSLRINQREQFQKDTFRVFDRVLIMGDVGEDGEVSTQHRIWLSSWQVENLRASHYLLIDYPAYKGLRNSISRVLFPMLKVWLYASRRTGRFEKRYDEFCAILGIKRREAKSQIAQQLRSALDELIEVGYISKWEILPAVGAVESGYKVVLHHHPDLIAQFGEIAGAAPRLVGAREEVDALTGEREQLRGVLTGHGIAVRVATSLLAGMDSEGLERARRIIEYFERNRSAEIGNPAGYLVTLIREGADPAVTKRKPHSESQADRDSRARLDEEITLQAMRDLELMREYQERLDKVIEALKPLEVADYHQRASERLVVEFPQSHTWTPETRSRQTEAIMKRLVATDYDL